MEILCYTCCCSTYLIFKVTSVAILINLNSQGILSIQVDQFRHIKLRWVSGALRVPHFNPIDPNMKGRVNTFESQPQLMISEAIRNLKRSKITSGLVGIVRNMAWIDWEGIVDVRVPVLSARTWIIPRYLTYCGPLP